MRLFGYSFLEIYYAIVSNYAMDRVKEVILPPDSDRFDSLDSVYENYLNIPLKDISDGIVDVLKLMKANREAIRYGNSLFKEQENAVRILKQNLITKF